MKRNMQMVAASHAINLKGRYTFYVDVVLDHRRHEYICTYPSEGLVVLETQGNSKGDAIHIMVQKLARDPVNWIKKGVEAIAKLKEMIDASKAVEEEARKAANKEIVKGITVHEDHDPGDEH